MAILNTRFNPFWFTTEDSRYVYKIKRPAKTGTAYRFKTRLIVRGFEMEKGKDHLQNFSPTPGIAIARTDPQAEVSDRHVSAYPIGPH